MKYLEKVGLSARKAFEELKAVKHSKIQLVLKNYNTAILKNKKKLIGKLEETNWKSFVINLEVVMAPMTA